MIKKLKNLVKFVFDSDCQTVVEARRAYEKEIVLRYRIRIMESAFENHGYIPRKLMHEVWRLEESKIVDTGLFKKTVEGYVPRAPMNERFGNKRDKEDDKTYSC